MSPESIQAILQRHLDDAKNRIITAEVATAVPNKHGQEFTTVATATFVQELEVGAAVARLVAEINENLADQ